jgi:hypothetical protein
MPSYFSDRNLLVHLAFILFPQLGDNALEKIALDYLDEEEEEEDPEIVVEQNSDDDDAVLNVAAGVEYVEEDTVMREKEDSDLEMLDCPPPVFKSVKKKKTMKIK